MITCPKCKNSKNLTIEQPTWSSKNRDNITLDCYCVECRINFLIEAKIETIGKAYNIEKNKYYPY